MASNEKMSVLISSCNKFSDLWDENIKHYRKYWPNNNCNTYLVTDTKTDWHTVGIDVVAIDGENNFPLRIKRALDSVTTPYVLVTLDDYYLINPVENTKIEYLLSRMIKEKIKYLSLYNRRVTKQSKYLPLEELRKIDLGKKYAITLYPAIWDVEFLRNTIKEDLSPWLYEASLTKIAIREQANCQASLAGTFDILDVVRKGKLLHKAKKYFDKNGINVGNRPVIEYKTELRLMIFDVISWYTPKKLFCLIKSVAHKMGMEFYSDN